MPLNQNVLIPVVAISAVLMASFPAFNEYILRRCENTGTVVQAECEPCPALTGGIGKAADCPKCQDCTKFAPKPKACPKCPPAATTIADGDVARKFTTETGKLLYPTYVDVSIWGFKSFESFYHNILPQKAQQFPYYNPASDFKMFAERDLGGWNNIRMGYEVAVSLAYKYRRRLAMPQRKDFYLVASKGMSIFDFYDETQFKAVIPTTDYFEQKDDNVFVVPKQFSISDNINKRKSMDELPVDKHWYFPDSRGGGTRIFEQYTELVDFQPKEDYIQLVHQAFRMRKDIVDKTIATLLSHGLKPHGYNAMHVRRNEFQYKDVRHVSIEKIYNHVKNYIRDEPLLIVSDEYNEQLRDLMAKSASRVVYWKCEGKCAPDQLSIDMLAAVPAKRFFGSPLSTFSAGIVQWRHRCHPDVVVQHTMPYTQDMKSLPTWGRPGEVVMPVRTNVWKDIGFEVMSVHHDVRRLLEDLYIDEREQWKNDVEAAANAVNPKKGAPIVKRLSKQLQFKLDALLKPMLEQWVGFELAPEGDHIGVREYHEGSTEKKNRESANRVVSIAIPIRVNEKSPWKTSIRDRTGTVSTLNIKDGEMLMYAGHSLEKSRRSPVVGKYAMSISHYYPKSWAACATLDCNFCGENCDEPVR